VLDVLKSTSSNDCDSIVLDDLAGPEDFENLESAIYLT
jgi:hypothetical protein